MDALGIASPDGVRKALERLCAGDFIALETDGRRRRVTIRASGARTDWSQGRRHPRAGAAYAGGWENGQDAILLRLAREGLDLATMADRLGRTPSSVRHRLRRLRAAGAVTEDRTPGAASVRSDKPAGPVRTTLDVDGRDPGPVQAHIITQAQRPAAERAQIAAFLAAGKARKMPPAYAGEVRGGTSLAGIAPISPLARRLVLVLEDQGLGAGALAARGRLDPLLMPELLRELCDANLAEASRWQGRLVYRRGSGVEAALRAMGLRTRATPTDAVRAGAPHGPGLNQPCEEHRA